MKCNTYLAKMAKDKAKFEQIQDPRNSSEICLV